MFKYTVQFFILFLLWRGNSKAKGSWFTSSGFLIGIYALCSLMGVLDLWVEKDFYSQPYSSSYWLPMLTFDLFILLFLLPFRIFNESSIKQINLPSRSFLDVFSTIIIILSFFSIAVYAPSVRNIFAMSDLGDARNMMGGDSLYFEAGLAATIGSVAAANYVFAIVLYFIYKIIGNSKTRCVLLLLSSLSEPIQVLSFVGRDGIVFWVFTFLFCYLFFRPFLPKTSRKGVLWMVAFAGVLFVIPFLLITISRFGESNIGTNGSIISYLGHAFIQGPLFFGIEDKPFSHGACFPLYYSITGVTKPYSNGIPIIGDWISWRFSTFVVSLYADLGQGGLVAVCMAMFFLFIVTFGRTKNKFHLGHLSLYLLYFQIISQGVFYFKQYTRGGNLFIITTIFLSILFSIITNNTSAPTVLTKVDYEND